MTVLSLWLLCELSNHNDARSTEQLFQGFLNFRGSWVQGYTGTKKNHICWLGHKEIYFGATIWYTLILLKNRTNFHTNKKNVLHFYSEWNPSGHVWDCRRKNITMFSPQTRFPNSIIITAESAALQKTQYKEQCHFKNFWSSVLTLNQNLLNDFL